MKPIAIAMTLAAALAAACQSPNRIDVAESRSAVKLEVQLDGGGDLTEVEYHVAPDSVPAVVREAMERLHPGGPFTDAEREYQGGVLYYELSRVAGGLEVEAMFTAAGELHAEEIQVQEDAVPAAVRAALASHLPAATVNKYEEIRDGSRQLVEYHVKLAVGGVRHKVILSVAGEVLGDYLELEAEIEVPVE